MKAYEHIQYSVNNAVARIVLNQPDKLNGLSWPMLDELLDAVDRLDADGARAVLLTGAGRAFCAGADLSEPAELDEQGRIDTAKVLRQRYHPLLEKFQAMDQPLVCAINGIAAGAGCSIAISGDITIAAQSASFLQAFVNIGLMHDAGSTWMLPRKVGRATAMGMALLGERMPAERALQLGLIWDVVPDAELDSVATATAEKLAAGPAKALSAIKHSINSSWDANYSTQLEKEAALQQQLGYSEDFVEGTTAFMEKRAAEFKGC